MQRLKRPTLRSILRWAIVPVVSFVLVVAVAMACAAWSPVPNKAIPLASLPGSKGDLPAVLQRYELASPGVFLQTGIGNSFYQVFTLSQSRNMGYMGGREQNFTLGRAGFPFRCMRWVDDRRSDTVGSSMWTNGIKTSLIDTWSGESRRIPLMPEPVGMVLNVLIVSAVIMLGRAGLRYKIRYHRKSKDRCMDCGYPIEWQVDHCPECGKLYPGAIETEASRA